MKNIALKYGLQMFIGFVVLFLFVHFIGLSDNYNLRILNGFIHFTFIYLAIRDYRRAYPESYDNYVSGVSMGMYTSMIGVVLFSTFMCFFLYFIDPGFYERIKAASPFPAYFTQFTSCIFILAEGIVVSLIGSYLVTRVIDARKESAS